MIEKIKYIIGINIKFIVFGAILLVVITIINTIFYSLLYLMNTYPIIGSLAMVLVFANFIYFIFKAVEKELIFGPLKLIYHKIDRYINRLLNIKKEKK